MTSGRVLACIPWNVSKYGPRSPTTVMLSVPVARVLWATLREVRNGACPSFRCGSGGRRAGPRWVVSGGPVWTDNRWEPTAIPIP